MSCSHHKKTGARSTTGDEPFAIHESNPHRALQGLKKLQSVAVSLCIWETKPCTARGCQSNSRVFEIIHDSI